MAPRYYAQKGPIGGGKRCLRWDIFLWLHSSVFGGHSSGDAATLKKLQVVFYWKEMTKDVKFFVMWCEICQRCKFDATASPGLLQPLPIPGRIWQHITMDFIEGLLSSHCKNVIYVVVDRLSKYVHFISLIHPYDVAEVTQSFLDNVFKLHGFPNFITSDKDAVFVNQFWKDLMAFQCVQVQLSTAYHP